MLVVTGLVLLIACANLANLMLARASAANVKSRCVWRWERREFACSALRLAESAVLACAGRRAGSGPGAGTKPFWCGCFQPGTMPSSLATGMDWRVLLFSASLAVLTCIVFGTAPALRSIGADPGAR